MKYTIELHQPVNASVQTLWQTLEDLPHYGDWNPFVIACESSLKVGAPIIMKVKLLPIAFKQKETIFQNEPLKLLEYGINIPLLLSSSRKHIVSSDDANADTCNYTSFFELRGPLAPVVGFLMGKALHKGFNGMTSALAEEAAKRHGQ